MTVRGRNGGTSPIGQVDSRALILIGAAVVIGLLLLARGFDSGADTIASLDSGDTAADDGGSTDGTDGAVTDGATTETTVAVTDGGTATDGATTDSTTPATDGATTDTTGGAVARDPSQIGTVLVANGSGTSGVAGRLTDSLLALNYTADAANAPDTSTSSILFREGYSAEAIALATSIGAQQTIVQQLAAGSQPPVDADAQDRATAANIIIIIGSDGAIPIG